MTDVTVEDATANVYPEAVPRAPDGSPEAETEITVDQAQAIGALDLESAAKNKRNAAVIVRKTNGEPRVSFGTKDALEMFDQVRQIFGTSLNSINIVVIRVRPEPMEQYLPVPMASMTDSTDLYKYVAACHGQRSNAQYKIIYRDGTTGNERGSAYIHMPDRRPVEQPSAPSPQQYPQPPQYSSGWGQPGGNPPASMGYSPYQGPPAQSHQAQAPQAPPVVHVHPQAAQVPDSSAAMGAMGQMGEMQKFFAEQSQRQNEQMMTMMREMMTAMQTAMRTPPPPAGFIPLPDNFPLSNVPAGYLKIPGGMIPAPAPPMPPPGYQAVPIASPAPAAAAAAASAAPVYQPIPQAAPGFNPAGMVNQYRDMMKGVAEIQKIAEMFQPRETAAEAAAEVAEAASPLNKVMVGETEVAYGKDGNIAWVPTLMAAAPKLVDTAKSVLTEYQKVQQKQHDFNQAAVQQRIQLANAVERAQQRPPPAPAALAGGPPPIHVRQAPVGVAAPPSPPPQYFEPEPPAPHQEEAPPEPPQARKPRPMVGIPSF